MPPTHDLPGLGPKSLAMLTAADIHGLADLERLGAVRAYLRVVAREERGRLLLELDAAQEATRR